MNEISDTGIKLNIDHDRNIAYIRFDRNSTRSTCSSLVLSSCSSDEGNHDNRYTPPLQWKRQKILNNDRHHSERLPNGNDILNNLQIDQNSILAAKENVAASFDDERQSTPRRRLPPIPEDKLHRRNPHIVRQELNIFDDFLPETTLADVHLNEMPGLQNTEQWKRIADRTVRSSPPLSRQYYQTTISTLELQDGQIPQSLGSYRRPGRSENEQDVPSAITSPWLTSRRRIIFGSSVAVVIVAIIVTVVLAVTLIRKSDQITSDYYEGSIYVRANFDPLLLDPTSTLARNYKKEFCTLVRRTLVDNKTKYARSYSTCSVIAFRNGSIIADFVLGFTRRRNVTRLNSFLNHTLVNQELFGGTILSITFNSIAFNINNNTNTNTTQIDNIDDDSDEDDDDDDDDDNDDDDDSIKSRKFIMNEQNLINGQEQSTQTSFTTVTYKTLDKGLSITISETITITNNNNFDKLPINNKNYELILVPTTDNTKTVIVPNSSTNEKTPLPPPLPTTTTTTTTDLVTKSPSSPHLLRPIKPISDTNFAYIDDSSDDRTISSGNATSTLEDITTRDSSTTSASTTSLDNETLINSTSTLAHNLAIPTTTTTSNQPLNQIRTKPTKIKDENSNEKYTFSSRSNSNIIKRQRRLVTPKKQRRLLQYELMPTGKIYYVDRPYYNGIKKSKDDNDSNSSILLSTVISRSSSVDTLSDKRYRHHHHHHHQQQQQNRKYYPNLSLKKPEQKLSIAQRLASNNNLPTTTSSPFKPINSNIKKKRFSSFEPTPESLDRVFDVLIAADKRREEHEFWREKFDHRTINSRSSISNTRTHDMTINSNTVPFLRTKQQTPLNINSNLNNIDNRTQSYNNKRNSSYDSNNRQSGCLLEDCLRRRTLIIQQQQQQQKLQQLQSQRNYSPNTIYSTNYPKQQLLPTSKPPLPTKTTATTTTNQQPVRIFPLSNGRIGRAPQARQTSDELSSISDVWATRSSFEDESHHTKKPINYTRFQSAVNRNRTYGQKTLNNNNNNNKRASSVEQQKSNRTQNKNLTAKSKFFDLFKFTR